MGIVITSPKNNVRLQSVLYIVKRRLEKSSRRITYKATILSSLSCSVSWYPITSMTTQRFTTPNLRAFLIHIIKVNIRYMHCFQFVPCLSPDTRVDIVQVIVLIDRYGLT